MNEPNITPSEPPKYRIAWRNKTNGRRGFGTKEFSQIEAQNLAIELDEEHPHMEHHAVPVNAAPAFKAEEEPKPVPIRNFTPLNDNDPFPNWGVHARQPMRTIPSGYWDWMRGQPQLLKAWPEIADYIDRNKRSINQDLERAER